MRQLIRQLKAIDTGIGRPSNYSLSCRVGISNRLIQVIRIYLTKSHICSALSDASHQQHQDKLPLHAVFRGRPSAGVQGKLVRGGLRDRAGMLQVRPPGFSVTGGLVMPALLSLRWASIPVLSPCRAFLRSPFIANRR